MGCAELLLNLRDWICPCSALLCDVRFQHVPALVSHVDSYQLLLLINVLLHNLMLNVVLRLVLSEHLGQQLSLIILCIVLLWLSGGVVHVVVGDEGEYVGQALVHDLVILLLD